MPSAQRLRPSVPCFLVRASTVGEACVAISPPPAALPRPTQGSREQLPSFRPDGRGIARGELLKLLELCVSDQHDHSISPGFTFDPRRPPRTSARPTPASLFRRHPTSPPSRFQAIVPR